MKLDLDELANFLVRAKKAAYAGDGKEMAPQRPGFRELEYAEGDYYYRDSYSGFYSAPGQEVVWHQGIPVWAMAYSGGMSEKYVGNFDFSKKTFEFLKKALLMVEASAPFRGPKKLAEGDFLYFNMIDGDIKNFKGTELIFYQGEEVFKQDYIGGLIIPK